MKVVLFTQRVEMVEAYNERRDNADQRIAEFIMACGFLPLAIPNIPSIANEIVDAAKPVGIILVGGNSLVKYGGSAPERDETDSELLRIAIDRHIPIYGFCRGMQSILDYFGNDLVEVKGHVAVRHNIYGEEGVNQVNSYHNQACISLNNDELIAVMKSEDGVIEKIRHKSLPIVGTMWHPERENPFRESDIELFKNLVGGQKE